MQLPVFSLKYKLIAHSVYVPVTFTLLSGDTQKYDYSALLLTWQLLLQYLKIVQAEHLCKLSRLCEEMYV